MELTFPMILTIIVVLMVVFFQSLKYYQNRVRIDLFSNIFAGQDYDLVKDSNDMVVGIKGSGNKIFDDIKYSINGYLKGTQGTEVDFQLLKDSVDRHCDMIEDEINSQMPLPLYFGLAGTMGGAIIGLIALVWGDAILKLMAGDPGVVGNNAATNINDLLWGVAIAMLASAIGIILTSLNTIYFKEKKLQEETQKNKFLAWMQSRVLAAVPSSVSQQMKALVSQLATFNRNFRSNTDAINTTLNKAKEVYKSQADVIEEYKAIDLEAIATGVSSIMRRLRSSTESLDNFTQYLDKVHEYYEEMQVFAEKLDKESERIGILQDIQKFFNSHKSVIAEETADAHKNIQESIKAVQDSTEQQVNETYAALTEQSQKLKSAVDENNKQFRELCQDMRIKFKEQMDEMPEVAQSLRKLEDIPSQLDAVVLKISQSQESLVTGFLAAAKEIVEAVGNEKPIVHADEFYPKKEKVREIFPSSLKWTIIGGIILISLATVGNTAYNIWKGEKSTAQPSRTEEFVDSVATTVPVQVVDSTLIQNP